MGAHEWFQNSVDFDEVVHTLCTPTREGTYLFFQFMSPLFVNLIYCSSRKLL